MRNPRKKPVRFTREDKLASRKKLVVLEPLQKDSEFPAAIVEEKKERKPKNSGPALMKKYGINTKKRGMGITRKSKDQNKSARKTSRNSRKTNSAIADKKFRASGSKKRK